MKILIVDDEVVSRKKLEQAVRSLGHDTLVTTDGTNAWEIWNRERPAVVITDWVMPAMEGPELCRRIREREGSRYTYLILVTSKTDKADLVQGMESGADDYIRKPFNREELMVRIKAGERVLGLQSRDVVIFSMAKLAESRDPDTGFHLERIASYSKALAESLLKTNTFPAELDSQFVDLIQITSVLHDIGKIGIPDHVLLKPGRFDDEEFEIMKTHTLIGHETLNEALRKYPRADYLKMSAEVALNHHEKYDGTGYPNAIGGEKIPLAARIVALADVYDALVSKRAYKGAYTHQVARSIIVKHKGHHFDPVLVEVFLKNEHAFVETHEKYRPQ